MLPTVIMYNSVSADGAIKGFNVDIALHYKVLGQLGIDALLVGSETAKSGIEIFTETIPPEEPIDFVKPALRTSDNRALWVIVDSRAIMQGIMHVHRRSDYARDIIVLVSYRTPEKYLDYLKARHYDFIIAGSDHVDYKLAFEELNKRYSIKTIATDTGGILGSALLEQKLIDEVQLLVAPEIVGKAALNLFRTLNGPVHLKLKGIKRMKGHVLIAYEVIRKRNDR